MASEIAFNTALEIAPDNSSKISSEIIYELWVILKDDDDKLKFSTHFFLNIDEAYVCYKEMFCELGKSFAVIELVELEILNVLKRDNARHLDSVSIYDTTKMKSLEQILKNLETPETYYEREIMIQNVRANDKKFSVYNPATEEKRKKLRKILRNMEDTENKRERVKYESDDTDSDTDTEIDYEGKPDDYEVNIYINN